jgi:hypothetical protein
MSPSDATHAKLVKVVWHDAADEERTWVKESELDEFADDMVEVVSFGYLVRKTAKYLTIAGDCIRNGTEETTWGRVCKVPVGMVVSVTAVEETE